MLRPAREPSGQVIPARNGEAEVVCQGVPSWHHCQVIAWHRLERPRRQDPHRYVEWLVRLRLADGTERWYEHSDGLLRPAGPGPGPGR